MAMTGIYGALLETVKGWLQDSSAFGAFSTDTTVHLYQRIGDGSDPEAGDAWGVLAFKVRKHIIKRQGAGAGVANFDQDRILTLALVKVVTAATNAAMETLISQVGAIVEDLIDNEDAIILQDIMLDGFVIDETTTPKTIGAELELGVDT